MILDAALRLLAKVIFFLFNDIEVHGVDRVPARGPVVIAANHPSYLDPVFIMHRMERPVKFLAWHRPFQIPLLGRMMLRYGAIPLDIENPGRASIEAAIKVLRAGEVFGIFPEGGRSKQDTMNPLKSGVARLAMMTGAPIVPVTISGGRKVWPRHRLLPRPGRVVVQFHEPIVLDPEDRARGAARHEAERRIVERVMAAINTKLLPAVRAEKRQRRLLKTADVPFDWIGEASVFYFLAAVFALGLASNLLLPMAWTAAWAAVFGLVAWVSPRVHPKSPETKALRNFAAFIVLAAALWNLLPLGPWRRAAAIAVVWVGAGWLQFFRFSAFRLFRRLVVPAAYLGLLGWLAHG